GGGMVEKCVNAVANTYTTVGGEKNGTTKLQFNVKPLAWSVNASAGFQVNIPGSLGIYAEPGVSYHFPDNSKVRSIYTEKPFDFVMSFGVRYSFR
ncbi:MAG: PorT family protein, partial [Bacteroidales bacterium]|nr:PorT family protein [Bacteroidales bacterium]